MVRKWTNWAHVDISNQIDNSWNKDTVIALKFKNLGYSVKIRENNKKEIEKRYIQPGNKRRTNRINRRIVVMVYCFILYKLLRNTEVISRKIKLCRDINPRKDVYRYLRYISKYFKENPIDQDIKIRFKEKSEGNSRAHKLANDTYKGRKKPDYLIKKKDMGDIFNLIKNFVLK